MFLKKIFSSEKMVLPAPILKKSISQSPIFFAKSPNLPLIFAQSPISQIPHRGPHQKRWIIDSFYFDSLILLHLLTFFIPFFTYFHRQTLFKLNKIII